MKPKLTLSLYLSKLSWNWYWNIKARNSRIVATSGEGYSNREDALHALHLLFGSKSTGLSLHQQVHQLSEKEVRTLACKKKKKGGGK